jgi:hypothetical protein
MQEECSGQTQHAQEQTARLDLTRNSGAGNGSNLFEALVASLRSGTEPSDPLVGDPAT